MIKIHSSVATVSVLYLSKPGTWDLVEKEASKPSIFKSRESLTPEYTPERLPHRENEMKKLVQAFRYMITSPGTISQRVLIIGRTGTGKTVLTKVFLRDFIRIAREKGVSIKYAHVNCHKNRTLFNVVSDISRQLDIPVPSRGLSVKEIYDAILGHLEETNSYAIIVLDEFHYFASLAGRDAVYFIVRTYDDARSTVRRLSFIFIALDTSMLNYLDPSIEDYLLHQMIKLEPYTSNQLYEILKYRADNAFYEKVVSDEALKFIADYEGSDKGGSGSARSAIEILLKAGDIAEYEGYSRVTLEHVRKAIASTSRELVNISEALAYSPLHELLIVLAIIRLLRKTGLPFVKIGDIEREYSMLCELFNEEPRRHTQIYEYIMNLKKTGVVTAQTSSKGMRGRSTLVSIHFGPLDMLEKYVEELIRKKLEVRK